MCCIKISAKGNIPKVASSTSRGGVNKDWLILIGVPFIITAIFSTIFLVAVPHRPIFCALSIKGKNIMVECAYTDYTRTLGLMYRKQLAENSGMLFIYPDERPLDFWMKNTRIPLSIAFIKADGTIADIKPMEPSSLERVASSQPVKYALEMNLGWYDRNNIKAGDKIGIPEVIQNIRADP